MKIPGWEGDCLESLDVPVVVAVTVSVDEARVDFTGTGAQIRGFESGKA